MRRLLESPAPAAEGLAAIDTYSENQLATAGWAAWSRVASVTS
jgi:hypothetical protein